MIKESDPSPIPNTGVGTWGWNGTTWQPILVDSEGRLKVNAQTMSTPPEGYYKVTNLYVDPSNGKLVIEYDDGGT
jgi:hypothetical protein